MSAAATETSRDDYTCDNKRKPLDVVIVSSSFNTPASLRQSKAAATVTPTDNDILCGRGKGIQKHPGNEFYNRLLRENYAEYKSAPKGSKLDIVKKIVSLVKEQRGRFLERQKERDNGCCYWVYSDIGDERATNKTSQAFRDIRATMERQDAFRTRRFVVLSDKAKSQQPQEPDSPSSTSNSDRPRRPTFQERLAMLDRQENANSNSSSSSSRSNEDDDETTEESGNEDEISDTETEDSFPVL